MSKLDAVLDDLHAVELCEVPDGRLLEEIDELLVARNRLDAAISLRLGRAHANDTCVSECGHGVKQYLVSTHHFGSTDAGRHVFVARALASYPQLCAAYQSGDISFEAVRAILLGLNRLPEPVRRAAEPTMVTAATSMSVDDLSQVLDALRELLGDQTAEEREHRRYDSRWLRTARTFEGMLHLEGMLDPESADIPQSALTALLSTRAEDDPRTLDQARADALTDLATQSLAHGDLPAHNGDRPTGMVTVDAEKLLDRADATSGRKPAPYDHDLADRLAELDKLVAAGMVPAHAATLGSGTDRRCGLTPEAARRILCDARIIPAALGGSSQVLDLGRETRTWSLSQRRAAALRDRGCTFTGCRAGLDRCELHHIEHWAHGGPTNHDNSAHLCRFHHWLVHHRNWTIHRDPTSKQIVVRRT